MNDLDELAEAARATPAKRIVAPASRRSRLAAGLAVAVGIAVVAAYFVARGINADPGFTVVPLASQNGGMLVARSFVIENRDPSPLTVQGVCINGTFHCPVGHGVTSQIAFPAPSRKWPVTIAIGEQVIAYAYYIGDATFPTYASNPVFVEVDSDRGRFKYDVADGTLRRE